MVAGLGRLTLLAWRSLPVIVEIFAKRPGFASNM